MTPAIALLLIGGILLKAGISNQSIVDVVLGRDNPKPTGTAPASTLTGEGGILGAIGNAVGNVRDETAPMGERSFQALFSEMDRIAGLNLPYKFGGGHGRYTPNGPFDCSGAVSYVLHAAGMMKGPPRTSTGFMVWGQPGRGQTFTVYANPSHVFIVDERTGRAWGTTRTTGRGGPAWHRRGTRGFVARTVQGDGKAH